MKKYLGCFFSFLLISCGFTPLYENDSLLFDTTINSIYIEPIDGIYGVKLRNALENNLINHHNLAGRGNINYKLKVKLTSTDTSMAIRSDDVATLIKSTYTAKIALREKNSGKTILQDSFSISTSRNVLSDPYGTVTSQDAGKERSVNLLANDIAQRIILFFRNQGREI
jgi:hypothetical protein